MAYTYQKNTKKSRGIKGTSRKTSVKGGAAKGKGKRKKALSKAKALAAKMGYKGK